jgi:hypothetical protein
MIFLLIWFVLTALSLLFIRWVNKNNLIIRFKKDIAFYIVICFVPIAGQLIIFVDGLFSYYREPSGNIKILNWLKGE